MNSRSGCWNGNVGLKGDIEDLKSCLNSLNFEDV